MNETDRITRAYEKRDKSGSRLKYSFFNPSHLFTVQQREKELIKILKKFDINDISSKKIFDLGCGNGSVLRDFLRYGANPHNCYGIDLLSSRIDEAKQLSPNLQFNCANAEALAYDSERFDMVLCFTVFTSIFDEGMKRNLAREMLRVLKPGGFILWYDYHMNNPRNSDVRGVKRMEIFKLFPDCEIHLNRVTLAPPITRIIAPYSWIVCYLLEKLKILNTHFIGIISKPLTVS